MWLRNNSMHSSNDVDRSHIVVFCFYGVKSIGICPNTYHRDPLRTDERARTIWNHAHILCAIWVYLIVFTGETFIGWPASPLSIMIIANKSRTNPTVVVIISCTWNLHCSPKRHCLCNVFIFVVCEFSATSDVKNSSLGTRQKACREKHLLNMKKRHTPG